MIQMLTLAGCPYIWKGGSSLMLLLAPRRNRLSRLMNADMALIF